ncbi:hypothetical protein [Xanthobacter sediminis]
MGKTAGDRTPRDVTPEQTTPEAPLPGAPGEVAAYIAALSEELSRLARGSGLVALAYILEMAKLEARNVVVIQAGAAKREGGAR